jgi:NAD-dependent SIR2 family protein deacetylase
MRAWRRRLGRVTAVLDIAPGAGRPDGALAAAVSVLQAGEVAVLTGAGVSTDSGIPDYRGPGSPARTPMTYQEFLTPTGRQRYWARSFIGWERMRSATPNTGHHALAALEQLGCLAGLVTQNVDGLHQEAGSRGVVDLHGRIDTVICLTCSRRSPRRAYQRILAEHNRHANLDTAVVSAPDGDAMLDDTGRFATVDCGHCGGIVKPDVVFFGESVRPDIVAAATALVARANALLVAGSSLTVYSGRRFVRQAVRREIPVLVINRGPTRADDVATVRIEAGTSETLITLAGLMAR